MRMPRVASLLVAVTLGFVLSAGNAWAQSGVSAAIAGVVRDATGAVLPGVTVEASSPALIEKVRTAVTDSQGQYRIVDLRPGTYTVTFSLPGFSLVSREGLDLTTGFTATVNADLRVGSIEETLTVTGAAPVVDIQNVRTQNVLTRDVLDSVPISKNAASFAQVTVGATGGRAAGGTNARDVGGGRGETLSGLEIRGDRQGTPTLEGLRINAMYLDGSVFRFAINQLVAQEIVLETSGAGAESESGGLNINFVLKDGGNLFRGVASVDYTGRNLQSDNVSDALRARGVNSSNVVTNLYDFGVGLGGPLVSDKLWFYTAYRKWGGKTELAGIYFNKTQNTLFFTPDLSRPGYQDVRFRDNTGRLTWQASPRHKIAGTVSVQNSCVCYYTISDTISPEAAFQWRFYPSNFYQATWTHPATNRLLFEAGGSHRVDRMLNVPAPEAGNAQPVIELSTGLRYGSNWSSGGINDNGDHRNSPVDSARIAMAYVTGSHALKTGMTLVHGEQNYGGAPAPVRYQFRNGVPAGLDQVATPVFAVTRLKYNMGLYAQDQWTTQRLTLSLGVRLDLLNEYNPLQIRPASPFTPEYRFEPLHNVPNWKDISPRLGAAYDLFGNGKTALKVALNRYVNIESTIVGAANNAAFAIAATTSRTWNDANGNYVPDCVLTNRASNGECGPMSNQAFGSTIVNNRWAPEVLEGWGVRPFNWQNSASLSHELLPGIGIELGYYRTWHGNLRGTLNQAVTPADFDPFCVTVPADARLPGGGGNQLCGFYDVKPAKFGQTNFLQTQVSNMGADTDMSRVYNGVQAVVNARFGQGGFFTGGIASGHMVTDTCSLNDRPETTTEVVRGGSTGPPARPFCRVSPPWGAETQVKFTGGYRLPWGINASAVFQNLSGAEAGATFVATNAAIAPSLGRNLSACGTAAVCNATVIVPIVAPGTRFEPRQNQLDVRLSKEIRMGQTRLRPRLDVYNVFNANSVLGLNTRFGPSWLRPSDVLGGRMVKVGAQLDF